MTAAVATSARTASERITVCGGCATQIVLTALTVLVVLWSLPLIALALLALRFAWECHKNHGETREREAWAAAASERAARAAGRPNGSVAEVVPLYPRAVSDRPRGGAA